MRSNMSKQGVGDFKYYVGISSLTQVATRDDRVCVLNILGGESSDVTPVEPRLLRRQRGVRHRRPASGGQVLETPLGNIPVYNNVREGLDAGHRFNCGVVYLPPSAARDGVAELIRVNPDLRKIFIVTEKMSVHDAREIRAMGQQNGIDIFGGNSLGVADSWNQVRIGGALGGDKPGDALQQGSIAIFSNSGGFTTTIAQYLRMAGWGTTTRDLQRQGRLHPLRGAGVRLRAGQRRPQQGRGAVLRAGRLLRARRATSPSRWWPAWSAAGRASSRAPSAMPARWPAATTTRAAKERWFMEKFGVDAHLHAREPGVLGQGRAW